MYLIIVHELSNSFVIIHTLYRKKYTHIHKYFLRTYLNWMAPKYESIRSYVLLGVFLWFHCEVSNVWDPTFL